MSRYIDYDAIDYRNDKMHDKSSDFIDGVIYMAQRIEEAPSIDIPQWTPCSERLPSDDNDYLVVDGDGEMAVGYYRDDADAWDNSCFGWLERDDEDEHPTRLGKVVAWMPLPKPWKGSDDD